MRRTGQVTGLACLFLVLLRMVVGWQFLYEGLWKLNTQETRAPWTSAGYLKNAQGPFRIYFRDMTGDPDDLNWLDYEKMAARWDGWHQNFLAHHPDLTDGQKRRIHVLLNGPESFAAKLNQLPDGVQIGSRLAEAIRYDAQRKRLIVDGRRHLLPAERDRLLAMVAVEESSSEENRNKNEVARAFLQAVRDVYKRSSRLSFKDRLAVLLKGDPDRAGVILEEHKGTIDYRRMGDIDLYRQQLKRYETNRAQARQDFQHEHLKKQWSEIQQLRAKLAGPVKALETELENEARKLLSADQLARGPVPDLPSPIQSIDQTTMWSLTILGALLIAGLFSRLTALAAAALLMSFYLAMPPWPGIVGFQELPGPEHSFIVDKNLIEIVALLLLVSVPTGKWFGVDALFGKSGS